MFSAACIEAGQEGRLAGHRWVGSVCSAQQVPGECVRMPGLEVTESAPRASQAVHRA